MAKEKTEENVRIEPTKSELEILRVLWEHGPSTVRFVMQELNKIRELNYTATLKLMQLMVDKGILKRDERKMQHVYHVVEAEDKTRERLLDKFLDTLYQGSAASLMIQLVEKKKVSPADLKKMKELLENLEKKTGKK
jgi:BlaI family transcriptional regulator, penicillinase repressor